MQWTVLVPVKALPAAKSRLSGFSADAAAHARLVDAIRGDTLGAARAAAGVTRVVRIGDAQGVEHELLQQRPGLNAALAEGARHAAAQWPGDGVAALVGDLPALTAVELAAALTAAAEHPTAFVADADGTGTTLLTATPPATLEPRFGPGSAARHGADAAALVGGAGLRQDVDTPDDLRAALLLGVGPRTLAVLAARQTSVVHRYEAS
ncbi:MAG TPA: 2-phospho-L-lactate guanylyltransferase [Jatrophihabitantaceae bacterium]